MTTKLATLWEKLRSSMWLLPTLLAAGASLLAAITLALDEKVIEPNVLLAGVAVYTGGPDGAREVLSIIAGSMIGIAGVTFSITIVAFSLGATQLGPRLLRSFMRDTGNQLVLGTFIGTFIFCILVLRAVRGTDEVTFVPHLSVTVGVTLGIASLGVLIYFIHHVSWLIQAPNVVAAVAAELEEAVARMFPEQIARGASVQPAVPDFDGHGAPIPARATGYLQAVDGERLLKTASRHGLALRLMRRPGHFMIEGGVIAVAWPAGRITDGLRREVAGAFITGPQRTPTQDAEFAVGQLVEVALRALSPGINDPYTAINCIDRLAAALARLARREVPSPYRCDEAGNLRLVADPLSYRSMVDAAFNQIRQAAGGQVAVIVRLLEAIALIGEHVHDNDFRQALAEQAGLIMEASRASVAGERDRRDVAARYTAAMGALGARTPSGPLTVGADGSGSRPDGAWRCPA